MTQSLKRQLLSKLDNVATKMPRCPKCNKRMKDKHGGGYKCPACKHEVEAEESVEKSFVPDTFPQIESVSKKKLSKQVAEKLEKHPGHPDQSVHGSWARNADTRGNILERKGKISGKGRKTVEVGASAQFKAKKLKMRPSTLKQIQNGWKSRLDDVAFSREDLQGQTPYIPVAESRFPKGSVGAKINQLIGNQVGRADAYYRHAMTLNPLTHNTERQSLLYRAEKFLEFSNKVLGPALQRELKKLDPVVVTKQKILSTLRGYSHA